MRKNILVSAGQGERASDMNIAHQRRRNDIAKAVQFVDGRTLCCEAKRMGTDGIDARGIGHVICAYTPAQRYIPKTLTTHIPELITATSKTGPSTRVQSTYVQILGG